MISCTCLPSALTSAPMELWKLLRRIQRSLQHFTKCDTIEGIKKFSHVIDTSGLMFRERKKGSFLGWNNFSEAIKKLRPARRRSCFKSFRAERIKIQSLFRWSRNSSRWSKRKLYLQAIASWRGWNQTWTAFMKGESRRRECGFFKSFSLLLPCSFNTFLFRLRTIKRKVSLVKAKLFSSAQLHSEARRSVNDWVSRRRQEEKENWD